MRTYMHTYANLNTHVCAARVDSLSPVGDGYETHGAALLAVTAGPLRPPTPIHLLIQCNPNPTLTSGSAPPLNEISRNKL